MRNVTKAHKKCALVPVLKLSDYNNDFFSKEKLRDL